GRRFSRGPFACELFCSVAAGADADADAGGAEADTAAIFIAAALDIALARRVTVGVALANDDAAFAAFAPAAAVFVADHADGLDVAVRGHRRIDGERCSRSGGGEERCRANRATECEFVHFILRTGLCRRGKSLEGAWF